MAKHTFCKTCGVQSFYTPRSNPDGFGELNGKLDLGRIFYDALPWCLKYTLHFIVDLLCFLHCECVYSVMFDDTGVAPHCLDPGTTRSVTVEEFCGENWEESMEKHQTIRSMSKPT